MLFFSLIIRIINNINIKNTAMSKDDIKIKIAKIIINKNNLNQKIKIWKVTQ